MYHPKHNLYFVHVPRTGGTSITKALTGRTVKRFKDGKHDTGWEYYLRNPERWEKTEKISIVRNPYDRILSLWRHTTSHNRTSKPFLEWLKKPEGEPPRVMQPQFLYHKGDERILYYELWHRQIKPFVEKHAVQPLKKMNNTGIVQREDYYTREAYDIVTKRYAEDFKRYDYPTIEESRQPIIKLDMGEPYGK